MCICRCVFVWVEMCTCVFVWVGKRRNGWISVLQVSVRLVFESVCVWLQMCVCVGEFVGWPMQCFARVCEIARCRYVYLSCVFSLSLSHSLSVYTYIHIYTQRLCIYSFTHHIPAFRLTAHTTASKALTAALMTASLGTTTGEPPPEALSGTHTRVMADNRSSDSAPTVCRSQAPGVSLAI